MKLSDLMTREEFEAWGNEDFASWMARQPASWWREHQDVIYASIPRTKPETPYDGSHYLDADGVYWIYSGDKWISPLDGRREQ